MKSVVAEHFDFSNLPTDHALYTREREHLIGVLKDEVDGKIISAFHVSSAKCYRATFVDDTSIAKCKGVPKSIFKEYTSKMYRDSVLLSNVTPYSTFRRIGVTSQQRQTALIEIRKLGGCITEKAYSVPEIFEKAYSVSEIQRKDIIPPTTGITDDHTTGSTIKITKMNMKLDMIILLTNLNIISTTTS